jgi:hypothetical protein
MLNYLATVFGSGDLEGIHCYSFHIIEIIDTFLCVSEKNFVNYIFENKTLNSLQTLYITNVFTSEAILFAVSMKKCTVGKPLCFIYCSKIVI